MLIMSSNLCNLVKKCVLGVNHYRTITSQIRLESTFKAAVLKELKKPLVIENQKAVKLKKNEVRIKVKYCSVNTHDVAFVNLPNLNLPFIPGYELSGEVIEVGEEVDKIYAQVGEKVAALSANKGGIAEQCIVNATDVWRLPSQVKLKQAAVVIHAHANALYTFSRLTKLKKDSKVVISTGPAGLGLAAVDVCANIFNVKPYGVCFSEELGNLVRERGAFKTALFNSKNLREDFKLPEGASVIYDAVGVPVDKILYQCIKTEGYIFNSAPYYTAAEVADPPINAYFMFTNVEKLRNTNNAYYRQIIQDTLDMLDQNLISPHISKTYKLQDVNEAIKFIEEKKCTGKVVIKLDD